MTTSDPVLYPLPQTQAESVRQDAARMRVELAETVEALAARFNVRRQVGRKIGSAGRRSGGVWAGGLGATAAVIVAGLVYPGGRATRRRRWATAGAASLVGMTTLRPMLPADVDEASDMILANEWGVRREFLAFASTQPACVPMVAEADDAIIGTGVGTANGSVGWIGTIFVEPDAD